MLAWLSGRSYIAVLLLLWLQHAEAGCDHSQVFIRDGRYSFWYGAAYDPPAGCSRSDVTVSKLYLQGACIATRDNSFGGKLPDCSSKGGSVDNTTATCEAVFAEGPREALISLADVDLGESFDTGTICTTQLYGYFFLESNCTGADKNHFSYQTNPIGGGLCWNGRTVSRGAVVGSAIASFLILFFIILAALAFVRRRQRTTQSVSMASQIHLQPYPQPPHNPFVVGDAAPYGAQQGSYPPPAASSSGQPSFDPYGNKPVTGIPVGNYGPRI